MTNYVFCPFSTWNAGGFPSHLQPHMWGLRTWFEGVHSGGRLMLDSVSSEVFSNLNNPVLTQISFRATPLFDCRCTKEIISFEAFCEKENMARQHLEKTDQLCLPFITKEVLTNQQGLTNSQCSALNLQLTMSCRFTCLRAQKSGNYNLFKNPREKGKKLQEQQPSVTEETWLSSGWASPPTHSHLSSSVSITA